ncbi:MAG: F0F1 ATP synthase subunit delta [Alphaproteobacteria bacterium]|nr:F0F1 ATP synthase subunit delta [Alphaproteobacteria bacterium]
MSSASQASSVVSARYANAFVELTAESKNFDKVAQDLNDLAAMIENSADLSALIRSPLLNPSSLKKAMQALAEKAGFQEITQNFIGVLIQNRRISELPGIIRAFKAEVARRRGEVAVQVDVAHDLDDKQKKELQAALSTAMGADVSVRLRVEPSILGGMIVTVGSRMIDDSVRRKLERLKLAVGAGSGAGF